MPLKIEVTSLSYDAKEYEYKGSIVAIRPMPTSMVDARMKDGAMVFSGVDRLKVFTYCLVGWNFLDANGQPLPCNAETKKLIFDFGIEPELLDLVVEKSSGFHRAKEAEEKNSMSGPGSISGD